MLKKWGGNGEERAGDVCPKLGGDGSLVLLPVEI
jgi:hypothetical protein